MVSKPRAMRSNARLNSTDEIVEASIEGYALLAGINRYKYARPLRGARNDVDVWKNRLIRSGWKLQNILVLLDEHATKEKLISGLRWLVSHAKPNDYLFFQFSGHGTWVRTVYGWECCICCSDYQQAGSEAFGVITGTEYYNELARKKPTVPLFCFLDSCFSGGMLKPPRRRLPANMPNEMQDLVAVRAGTKDIGSSWIVLRNGGTQVNISDFTPADGYIIPVGVPPMIGDDPLQRLLYFDVMYPISEKGSTAIRRFSLMPPDPWMVAVAYVMAEGVIQGLAWDVVQVTVKSMLAKLRRRKLAPTKRSKSKPQHGKSRKGFIWEEYATDDEKMYELFIGVQETISQGKSKNAKAFVGKRKVKWSKRSKTKD